MCGHGFETGVDSYLFRQVCCSFSGLGCVHAVQSVHWRCALEVLNLRKVEWFTTLSLTCVCIRMRLLMYVGARVYAYVCAYLCMCGCWVSDWDVSTVLRTGVCVCAHARVLRVCVCACVLVWCRKVDMLILLKLDIHMYVSVCTCVCLRVCLLYVCECVFECIHELVIDELWVSHISTVLGDTNRVCHIAYSMCLW